MVTYKFCEHQIIYFYETCSAVRSVALFDTLHKALAFDSGGWPRQELFFAGAGFLPLGDWLSFEHWIHYQHVLCYPCSCSGLLYLRNQYENVCNSRKNCIFQSYRDGWKAYLK